MTPHPCSRSCLALAVLAVTLAPRAAPAAEEVVGVLTLAPPPGPGPELAALAGQVRAALAARAPGVLDASALRARMVGAAPAATLAELDRAYAGALGTYAAGDYEQSVRTLRIVAAELERLPEGPEVFAQWGRAVLRLARVEQVLGRAVEAQVDLERLLAAEPQARADPRQFPPSFGLLLDEVRQRLAAAPRHRLAVAAPGATAVFVDGREVGPAPAAVEVIAGTHRVSARRAGLRVATDVVEVAGDRAVELDTSLAEVLRPDGGPGLALAPAEAQGGIVGAAARLGLDRAVTVATLQAGDVTWMVATLHDVRRGAVEREGRLRLAAGLPPPRGPDALAAFLLTGTPSGLVDTPAGPSLTAPAPAPGVRSARSHRHLGFYVRPTLDFGYASSTGGGRTLSGGAIGVGGSAGAALVENLILAGRVWAGGPMSEGDHQILAEVGPELTWYIMPQNLYVTASAGVAQLTLVPASGKSTESGWGFAAHLAFGREWWVSDHWGVGVGLQGVYGSTPGKNAGDPAFVTWGTSLSVSATYN